MSEKKRIAVVMDPSDPANATGSSFDFEGFQEEITSGGNTPSNAMRSAAHDDSASYTTSYQTRKTSIADGLSSEQLVVEHRKSIANVTGADAGNLGGVTLSRRQSMSHEEYNEELNQDAYQHLQPFVFKADDENGTTNGTVGSG